MSIIVNDVMAVEDGEHADQQSAVPVISDTPPIVALSSQVGEGFERQLIIVIQEHLWSRHGGYVVRCIVEGGEGGGEKKEGEGRGGEGLGGRTYLHLPHTDPQVRLIELIWDVPPEGTKLASLLHQSMEEAEPKEKLLPYLGLQWRPG